MWFASENWFWHLASTVFCQSCRRVLSLRFSSARDRMVSVERLAGSDQADRFERLADNQRHALLGRLEKKLAMNDAEKLVMMMDATSSSGSFFSPSAVLHVNCPSRQLSEHCGVSMLTMWYDRRHESDEGGSADDVVGHAPMPVKFYQQS